MLGLSRREVGRAFLDGESVATGRPRAGEFLWDLGLPSSTNPRAQQAYACVPHSVGQVTWGWLCPLSSSSLLAV